MKLILSDLFGVAIVLRRRTNTKRCWNAAHDLIVPKPLRDLVEASPLHSQVHGVLRNPRHIHHQSSSHVTLPRKLSPRKVAISDLRVVQTDTITLFKRFCRTQTELRIRVLNSRRRGRHSAKVCIRYAQLLYVHLHCSAATRFAPTVHRTHLIRVSTLRALPN